ncbi:MAG: phycobiliprotein lyase [Prochlorothrix sp.]|nr:phycobiliprotein lyase [Prochlorothrix sp.]
MTLATAPVVPSRLEQEAAQFLQASVGTWHSQRRYHTLSTGTTQDAICSIQIVWLDPHGPELLQLARRHTLNPEADPAQTFVAGVQISWKSRYLVDGKPQTNPHRHLTGSSCFGVLGDRLYRDRGFSTTDPITSRYSFPQTQTLLTETAYDGSSFVEECKLLSPNHRTRQTLIHRQGVLQVVGQYVEVRETPSNSSAPVEPPAAPLTLT